MPILYPPFSSHPIFFDGSLRHAHYFKMTREILGRHKVRSLMPPESSVASFKHPAVFIHDSIFLHRKNLRVIPYLLIRLFVSFHNRND